ncbi:MAG: acetylglutamate kinase [Treponema sp.]|jgi:acetylglutamate kinase|nr:acetylglutamate kinase [Treponema sp.]
MMQTTVIKYGGSAMINETLKTAVIEDLIRMARQERVILVHGGGPEIDAMLRRVNKVSRFVNGLRYTDEETMEIVQMVLCGKLNKEIAALIQAWGGRAVGLCGIDGGLLKARRIKSVDLGLVGEIENVDINVLNHVMDRGFIPVVSSVALGLGEDAGRSLNVNADTAAAELAVATKAARLILMTDVPGLLRDLRDPSSLICELSRTELEQLRRDGVVSKGMIPKTDCCIKALAGGVRETRIVDGRRPHALLSAQNLGTVIV